VALFCLLPIGYIEEDAKHRPADDPNIFTLTTGRDPTDLFSNADTEICFVGTKDSAGSGKGCPHPVPVSRMNVVRQFFESDGLAPRQSLKLKTALIPREPVIVHVRGPQSHASGLDGEPEMIRMPGVR
jgi:hypothetical protein